MNDAIPSDDDAASLQAQVPEDFPRPDIASAVPGFQPKLCMVEYKGKYYLPGGTPPERRQRWVICEDLAVQFAEKCRRNQTGKYSHLSEVEILDQYCVRLLKTRWHSAAELKWVIRRAASMLGWPVPDTAK